MLPLQESRDLSLSLLTRASVTKPTHTMRTAEGRSTSWLLLCVVRGQAVSREFGPENKRGAKQEKEGGEGRRKLQVRIAAYRNRNFLRQS